MARLPAFRLGVVLALAAPPRGGLAAQCPDGSPPPCAVAPAAHRVAPPPPADRARRFLILPFRNLSRRAEHDWLVEGAVALLGDALGQWQEISVVPDRRLFPLLARHGVNPGAVIGEEVMRRLAAETGGWTVVTGEVLAAGDAIRLRAVAYDAATGRDVGRATEQVPAAEVLSGFERLAATLLGTAELRLRPGWIAPSATTTSLEAYKAFLRGLQYTYRVDPDSARAAFERAVTLDSAFALAHVGLALSSALAGTLLDEEADAAEVLATQGRVAQSVLRATRHSTRLPTRERQLVQSVAAMFRGQFATGRAVLDSMVVTDSNDYEALALLAALELYDPVLVSGIGGERRRGSPETAALLAKRALLFNPARSDVLVFLARIYREAAGYWIGSAAGIRREPQSLMDLMGGVVDRRFLPLLDGDTLRLVPVQPVDSLALMDSDSVAAARRWALVAAHAWAEQWLAGAPGDHRALSMMAHDQELAGDWVGALATLDRAESLQPPERDPGTQRYAARRMVLLARLGRDAEAGSVLDSLWVGGFFGRVRRGFSFPRDGFMSLAWAAGLLLKRGDVARADTALASLGPFCGCDGAERDQFVVDVLAGRFPNPSRRWWAYGAAALSPELLRAAVQATSRSGSRIPAAGVLERVLPELVRAADRVPK